MTDRYPEVSIKNAERQHRAASGAQKIHISKSDQPIPKKWKKYLAHGYNKENLVIFFFETWKKADVAALKGVTVFLTHGEQCHSITPLSGSEIVREIAQLTNCSHKEADTRIFLHATRLQTLVKTALSSKARTLMYLLLVSRWIQLLEALDYIFIQEEMNTCAQSMFSR